MGTAINVGDAAPDFKGRKVVAGRFEGFQLSKELGPRPVLLTFFPFTFSGACTKQMCDMRDAAAAGAAGLDAKVLAVSIDSVYSLREFQKTHRLPYDLVSDGHKEGIAAWGVQYDEFLGVAGVAKRAAFVIDRAGKVRYVWVTEDADVLPPLEEIRALLAAIK